MGFPGGRNGDPGPVAAPHLAGATVLVLDDNDANVLLIQRLLDRAGAARVVGITDARRAVDTYVELQPDLVLVDLHMPYVDGHSLLGALRSLKAAEAFVPVVVLTADTTVEAKNRALAGGASDFLTKPFEPTEVLLRVNNLLETRSLHLALQRQNADLEEEIRRKGAREREQAKHRATREKELRRHLDGGPLTMVYQPIVNLRSNAIAGFEALARFSGEPVRPPNEWFAEAADLGLGTELELLAVESALGGLAQIPEGVYIAVNVSPETALDARLASTIESVAERVVIELTEHAAVSEYESLVARMRYLRELGSRLAVDDAGAGYASLQHILRLSPDIIKLDIDLTRGIDNDPARRALAVALVQFGNDIGAAVAAEGIERPGELETLRRIGASSGQGYLLGHPAPLPDAKRRTGVDPSVPVQALPFGRGHPGQHTRESSPADAAPQDVM